MCEQYLQSFIQDVCTGEKTHSKCTKVKEYFLRQGKKNYEDARIAIVNLIKISVEW